MAQRDRFGGRFGTVLAGARRGEPEALDAMFTTLAPAVAGYLRLQGCREPDDLTSEVFVDVLRDLRSFRGDETAFRSRVFAIAQRRLLDERHGAARTAPSTRRPAGAAATEAGRAAVARSLEGDHIRALCAKLPPDQRNVVLLRLLGRLGVDEVAAVLGKTSGGVRAAQRQGFQTLGRLIDKEHARAREREQALVRERQHDWLREWEQALVRERQHGWLREWEQALVRERKHERLRQREREREREPERQREPEPQHEPEPERQRQREPELVRERERATP